MARKSPLSKQMAPQGELWNSRPWAAYVLGHDTVAIELWWVVFIQASGEEYHADDNLPLCLDLLKETLTELVGEIDIALSAEISRLLAELRSDFLELAKVTHQASSLPVPWSGKPPFVDEREQLLRLADRALSPTNGLRAWFRLGRAVGYARLQLHLGGEKNLECDDRKVRQHEVTNVKRFVNEIKRAASSLEADDRTIVPLAGRLARLKPFTSVESTRQSLQRLVSHKNKLGLSHWPLLDNLLMIVDARLRDQLRRLQVAVEQSKASQRRKSKKPTSPTGWTADEEARNKWIYEQNMSGTRYKAIIAELNRQIAAGKKWGKLTSIAGIKKASQAYADRKRLPLAPKRRRGRPKEMID